MSESNIAKQRTTEGSHGNHWREWEQARGPLVGVGWEDGMENLMGGRADAVESER